MGVGAGRGGCGWMVIVTRCHGGCEERKKCREEIDKRIEGHSPAGVGQKAVDWGSEQVVEAVGEWREKYRGNVADLQDGQRFFRFLFLISILLVSYHYYITSEKCPCNMHRLSLFLEDSYHFRNMLKILYLNHSI